MNQRSDTDRLLRHWMSDGPSTMPDRVIDVVADRIGRQPQRRAWRLQGRPFMNAYLKLAAGLAAVVLVAVVGYNLLPRMGIGGPGSTPSLAPSPTPTAAPTAPGIRDVPAAGGILEPGQWRFHPSADNPSLAVVATLPAGWVAADPNHVLENLVATNSPPAGLAVAFELPAHGVFSDPCQWDVNGSGSGDQDGDVAVGPEVADLVAALRANTSFTSSAPTPVSFGSFSGQRLVLTFPADLDPVTCDVETGQSDGVYRVMPDTIWSQGKANIWDVTVVDVAGTRLVVIIEHFPGTAPAKVADAQGIVDSLQFTP